MAKLAQPLKGHDYHRKSEAELRYIIKDAGEAAKAMRGHNPKAEGKYADQVNDASTILHYRSKGGKRITESVLKITPKSKKSKDMPQWMKDYYGPLPDKYSDGSSTKLTQKQLAAQRKEKKVSEALSYRRNTALGELPPSMSLSADEKKARNYGDDGYMWKLPVGAKSKYTGKPLKNKFMTHAEYDKWADKSAADFNRRLKKKQEAKTVKEQKSFKDFRKQLDEDFGGVAASEYIPQPTGKIPGREQDFIRVHTIVTQGHPTYAANMESALRNVKSGGKPIRESLELKNAIKSHVTGTVEAISKPEGKGGYKHPNTEKAKRRKIRDQRLGLNEAVSSAHVTAMNQLRLAQRAAEENRHSDAADLVHRSMNNLKKDGRFYKDAPLASKLKGLHAYHKEQASKSIKENLQLDELSKPTLRSYAKKAMDDIPNQTIKHNGWRHAYNSVGDFSGSSRQVKNGMKDTRRKISNRKIGLIKAVDKLTRESTSPRPPVPPKKRSAILNAAWKEKEDNTKKIKESTEIKYGVFDWGEKVASGLAADGGAKLRFTAQSYKPGEDFGRLMHVKDFPTIEAAKKNATKLQSLHRYAVMQKHGKTLRAKEDAARTASSTEFMKKLQVREDTEQLQELSTNTLIGYKNKVQKQYATDKDKSNRMDGVMRADKALKKKPWGKKLKEDTEQLHELSTSTLSSYAMKADRKGRTKGAALARTKMHKQNSGLNDKPNTSVFGSRKHNKSKRKPVVYPSRIDQ